MYKPAYIIKSIEEVKKQGFSLGEKYYDSEKHTIRINPKMVPLFTGKHVIKPEQWRESSNDPTSGEKKIQYNNYFYLISWLIPVYNDKITTLLYS